MSSRRIKIAALLVGAWCLALGAIFLSRAARPTPESLARYIRSHPLAELTPAQRQDTLDRVADQLNRLTFEQRRELRSGKADRTFFQSLTEEERARFLEKTLPEGFRQLMDALNKMKPEDRQKIVRRALDDIERDSPEIAERVNRETARKAINDGLSAFYEQANADVKLDFAPVIEQLQRATQGLR